jgi:hypothetical protein
VDDINTFTFWVRQPEVFNFKFRLYYGPDDFDQTVNVYLPDDNWTEFDFTDDIRTTGALEGVRIYSYNGGGGTDPDYTYLDGISVNYGGGSAVESASLGELKAVFH